MKKESTKYAWSSYSTRYVLVYCTSNSTGVLPHDICHLYTCMLHTFLDRRGYCAHYGRLVKHTAPLPMIALLKK
jgi:hypothetical protein